MLFELIEKKNQPVKTKVQFTKKEWAKVPEAVRKQYEKQFEKHETARLVYFICEGDLINARTDQKTQMQFVK